MHILHINSARSWRGGEQQTCYLIEELARRGIRQTLATAHGAPLSERLRRLDLPNLTILELPMRGELDFFTLFRLRAQLQRHDPPIELIHAHTAKAHSLGLLLKRFGIESRLVVSRRVDFPARSNFLSRRKYHSPLVDRYLAISENVRRILSLDGIPAAKISIAYSGIDRSRFAQLPDPSPLRREFELDDSTLVIGNIAALVDHKDQSTLIRALKRLATRSDMPPWVTFVIGEGELRRRLESEAVELIADRRLIFTGFRNDITTWLSLFDLFVMSSKEEGLGTAVLDAMASHLAVATTAGGGLPEMIDVGRGGFVVPVGDDAALADSIAKLLIEPALRKKFADYNLQRVCDFSREATADATLRLYEELLGC